jgi:hypothetical protein
MDQWIYWPQVSINYTTTYGGCQEQSHIILKKTFSIQKVFEKALVLDSGSWL